MKLKLNKPILISIFLLLIPLSLISCNNEPKPKEIKGLFFEVEKDGKTSYLVGSIHYFKDFISFTENAEEAYSKSDRIAVEIDITDPNITKEINQDITYLNDDTLDNHITRKSKEYLLPILKEINLPYDKLKSYKPGIAYSVINQSQLGVLGYYPGRGIDMTLLNKAKKDNKEIYSIETVDEQLKAIYFDNSDQYANELLQSCIKLDSLKDQLENSTQAITTGDLESFENIQTNIKYEGKLKEWATYAIDERNVTMSERIDKLFQEDKTTMAVIGAAHLPGNNGVIDLLKSKGYKITQIN